MGLKTKNYTVKDLGITLPTAYAIIKNISVQNDLVTAVFVIQSDREKAMTLKPLETVSLVFKFNRNENPVQTAYNLIKGKMKDFVWNDELQAHEEKEVEMALFGWKDDIIED